MTTYLNDDDDDDDDDNDDGDYNNDNMWIRTHVWNNFLTSTGSVDLIFPSNSANDFEANGAAPNTVSAKREFEHIRGVYATVESKYFKNSLVTQHMPSPDEVITIGLVQQLVTWSRD